MLYCLETYYISVPQRAVDTWIPEVAWFCILYELSDKGTCINVKLRSNILVAAMHANDPVLKPLASLELGVENYVLASILNYPVPAVARYTV